MIVREVMTQDPYVANVKDSIQKVVSKLLEADIRHLPIVDAGNLVGIISDRDLRSILPNTPEAGDPPTPQALTASIGTVMNTDVLSIDPEAEVPEAIDLMLEHRVGAIPVVEPGTLRLIGIVSYVDLLRAARDLF